MFFEPSFFCSEGVTLPDEVGVFILHSQDEIISILFILFVEFGDSLYLFGEEVSLPQQLLLDGLLGVLFHLDKEFIGLLTRNILVPNLDWFLDSL